jgi:hypothetical protein
MALTERLIGPFTLADLAAGRADAAIFFAGGAVGGTTMGQVPAPRAGRIVGVAWASSAAVSAGSWTLSPAINNVSQAAGQAVIDTAGEQNNVVVVDNGTAYAAAALLGLRVSSTAGLLPAGTMDITAWLIVREEI